MNQLLKVCTRGVIAAGILGNAVAAPLNFEVSCERRKLKTEKRQTEGTNQISEQWDYKVVVQNKMFQPVEGLDAVYRIYKLDDSPNAGAEKKLIATPGSVAIGSLKPGAKFTFETENVTLDKSTLKGGWTYTDGSKSKVEDGVAGLWLRVMKDGAIVFEYMKPTALSARAKW
jgi:hypothetical protein